MYKDEKYFASLNNQHRCCPPCQPCVITYFITRKAKSWGWRSKDIRLRKWIEDALKKIVYYQLIGISELLSESANKNCPNLGGF